MEKYTVYKITNVVNNKIYIGASTNGADFRLKQHIFKANNGSNYTQHQAIREYGKDAFYAEDIEECPDFETMNIRETYWIAQLGSTNPSKGYNARCGGGIHRHDEHAKKKIGDIHRGVPSENRISVIQYDRDGNYIAEYDCITDAAKANNISNRTILRTLNKQSLRFSRKNPYIWVYKTEDVAIKVNPADYYKDLNYQVIPSDSFVKARNEINKSLVGDMTASSTPVEQYRLDGVLIAKFRSLSEASKITGISVPTIRKYINDENYINTVAENRRKYIWKKGDINDPELKIAHEELLKKAAEVNTIHIDQFDYTGKFVQSFAGIKKLCAEIHADGRTIKKYIESGRPYKGYIYQYKTEQSNII